MILTVMTAGQDFRTSLPDTLDFGTIHEKDGKAVREITFTNTGADTLLVESVTTACRCISGEAEYIPVAPGEDGKVKVTFDPAYRNGVFSYTVVVWYNGRKARHSIRVTGEVIPMSHPVEEDHPYSLGEGLYTSHKVLPFGSLKCGETERMFFRYGNGTDKPMDIRFEVEGCCSRHVVMEHHVTLPPDGRRKMYVSLTMPQGWSGSHVNRIWVTVNGVRIEKPITITMKTIP